MEHQIKQTKNKRKRQQQQQQRQQKKTKKNLTSRAVPFVNHPSKWHYILWEAPLAAKNLWESRGPEHWSSDDLDANDIQNLNLLRCSGHPSCGL
jgi:hypothetical protein